MAAFYQRALTRRVGLEVYLAPSGEPALGPVAFPHRPSAADDPFAPLAHHWQDATHVSFGVATLGLFTRTVKVEGSWFNGREPDQNRTDFDFRGRRLDSWAVRLSVNPAPRWSFAAWLGFLKSPDALHPDTSLCRYGASILTQQPWGRDGSWASALIWGVNRDAGSGTMEPSLLLETTLDLNARDAVFGRAEYVRKTAEDLVVPGLAPATALDLGSLTAGYRRALTSLGGVQVAIGALGTVTAVPADLRGMYGSRLPCAPSPTRPARADRDPRAGPGSACRRGSHPDRETATQIWPYADGTLEGFCAMVLGGAAPLATGTTGGVQFFSNMNGTGRGTDLNHWNYHGFLTQPDGSQAVFKFQMHWREWEATKVTASLH